MLDLRHLTANFINEITTRGDVAFEKVRYDSHMVIDAGFGNYEYMTQYGNTTTLWGLFAPHSTQPISRLTVTRQGTVVGPSDYHGA